MSKTLIQALSTVLQKPSDQIQIEAVRRNQFQLAHSPNKIFWITTEEPKKTLFLALHPVDNPNLWYLKNQKTSIEIINSLNLKYSTCPKIIDYFRTTYQDNLYDGVLMEKGKGILIQNLFVPEQIAQLKSALFAFGRALAELHLKKIQPNGKPSKKYEQLIGTWLDPCLEDYESIGSPIPKHQCVSLIDRLRKEAYEQPMLTGVIYYDPHPNNLMYNPQTDKVVFLDIDKMTYSISKKGESVGPIVIDYTRARYDINKTLAAMDLPENLIDSFETPYRELMGNHYPHEAQLPYFQLILLIKTLWFARQLETPSDIQLNIRDYARTQIATETCFRRH